MKFLVKSSIAGIAAVTWLILITDIAFCFVLFFCFNFVANFQLSLDIRSSNTGCY